MEPGGTILFWGLKVSLLATRRLCFMYNSAKVGECYIVNCITYSTCLGTDEPFIPTVRQDELLSRMHPQTQKLGLVDASADYNF